MADSDPFFTAAPENPATVTDGSDDTFTPVHQFDYTPIQNNSADKDELANMWLSRRSPQDLGEIESRAKKAGLSLDDVLATAEQKLPENDGSLISQRTALHMYRIGGPIFRGYVNSAGSTYTFLTNLGYRGLSNAPGYEHLATKADEQNRDLSTTEQMADVLNREGSTAQVLGSGGAALLGNASQGLFDLATVGAATGGAGVIAEGATAEEILVASKAAQMSAAKKAALFFGVKRGEQALTDATDHGLSPNMRIAHAAVTGSIIGAFTLGFGKLAQSAGITTAEQAIISGKPAVERLVQRSGLAEAAAGLVLSGGEQVAMSEAESQWGAMIGTGNLDDSWNRRLQAFETGAVMRGAAEVLPAVKNYHDAYIKAQEALPDTVKGTIDAQNAQKANPDKPAPPAETASQNYKDAYQSELDAIAEMHSEATKALDKVKVGEDSLAKRVEAYNASKKSLADLSGPNAISDEMRQQLKSMGFSDAQIAAVKPEDIKLPKAAIEAGPTAQTEGQKNLLAKLQAEQADLAARRQAAEADIKAAEDLFAGLDDPQKEEIKKGVIEHLETKSIADNLQQGRVTLTRAENSLNEQYRAQEGYKSLPESERISKDESVRQARASGLVQKADDIAKDIVDTGRGMSSVEQTALELASLDRDNSIVRATKTANDANATESARNDAAIVVQNARKSADVISQAMHKGASDPARMLAFRKVDNLAPAHVSEYATRVSGGKASEAAKTELTNMAVDVSDIEYHARKLKDEIANSQGKPLTEDGFVFKELLRAESAKRNPLSKAEEADVTARAKKIFANSRDIIKIDRERSEKAYNDLYVGGQRLRGQMDLKLKSLEPRTGAGQLGKYGSFLNGFWRGWLTGGDLFPLFRQGITHPIISTREGIPSFFKTLFGKDSQREAVLIQKEVKEHKYYKLSQQSDGAGRLAIMESDAPFALREGSMWDAAHEAIPVLGRFQQAFRVSLNKLRMEVFAAHIDSMGGPAAWDSANLAELGKFVNNATGRGSLGDLEGSASKLSKWMIGPRFFASRLTYMTPLQLATAAYKGNNTAVQLMLKTYAKQVAGLAAMTMLAEQGGKAAFGDDQAEFYKNPLDFNFGRLRIGSTMIDITGGLARPYRYATALFEPLIAKAQDRPSLKKTGPTLLGIARGQLAPGPSALVSAGEVYMERKQAGPEAMNFIVPWSYGDSIRAFQNEGVDKASAIAALSIFGGGSYTTERQ